MPVGWKRPWQPIEKIGLTLWRFLAGQTLQPGFHVPQTCLHGRHAGFGSLARFHLGSSAGFGGLAGFCLGASAGFRSPSTGLGGETSLCLGASTGFRSLAGFRLSTSVGLRGLAGFRLGPSVGFGNLAGLRLGLQCLGHGLVVAQFLPRLPVMEYDPVSLVLRISPNTGNANRPWASSGIST